MALDWPTFGEALWRVNDQLGIRPEWQLPVLHLESNFNPSVVNPYGCVGINQFCPGTYASYVRVPVEQYRTWPASAQLAGPVFAFWRDALSRGPIQSAARLLLAQFGQERLKSVPELDNVLFRAPSLAYERNKGLDVERKGSVTEQDLANVMHRQAQLPAVADAITRAYALRPNDRPRETAYGDDYPIIVPPTQRSPGSAIAAAAGLLALVAAAGYSILKLRPRFLQPAPPEPHPEFDYRSRL